MKYLVGIDAGSSSCKVCVFDTEGNCVGKAVREYPNYYPQPGMVEEDGEEMVLEIIQACKTAVEKANASGEDVLAVAFSTQGGPLALMDSEEKLMGNFISWQDLRGFMVAEELMGTMDPHRYYEISGLACSPSNPFTKLLWMRKFDPNFQSAVRYVTFQEYFLKRFGADEYVMDEMSCERIGLGSPENHDFSEELLNAFQFDRSKFGKVVKAGTIVGTVRPDIAELTGFSTKTLLCVGSQDSSCDSFGVGVLKEGDCSILLGTMGSLTVVKDQPVRVKNEAFVVNSNGGIGNWRIDGLSFTASSCYKWFRDTLCSAEVGIQKSSGIDAYDMINHEVAQSIPGANGITFMSTLQGGPTVYYNLNAKGAFTGITMHTSKGDLARAVMEGICYEMRSIIDYLESEGVTFNNLKLIGGATRSPLWCQMMSDITQKPLFISKNPETGCLGAAMYAGIGSGVFRDAEDAVSKCVRLSTVYAPSFDTKDAYEEGYQRYMKLIQTLNTHFY